MSDDYFCLCIFIIAEAWVSFLRTENRIQLRGRSEKYVSDRKKMMTQSMRNFKKFMEIYIVFLINSM